jgi:hypothetical protein
MKSSFENTNDDSTDKVHLSSKTVPTKIISLSNEINFTEHNFCNIENNDCNCTQIPESLHSSFSSESFTDDTDKDKDFNIDLNHQSSESDSVCGSADLDDSIIIETVKNVVVSINKSNEDNSELLSEKILKEKKRKTKLVRCKFCNSDIATKNFMRHLKRHHSDEDEVRKIFRLPKNSKERRQAFALLRNTMPLLQRIVFKKLFEKTCKKLSLPETFNKQKKRQTKLFRRFTNPNCLYHGSNKSNFKIKH